MHHYGSPRPLTRRSSRDNIMVAAAQGEGGGSYGTPHPLLRRNSREYLPPGTTTPPDDVARYINVDGDDESMRGKLALPDAPASQTVELARKTKHKQIVVAVICTILVVAAMTFVLWLYFSGEMKILDPAMRNDGTSSPTNVAVRLATLSPTSSPSHERKIFRTFAPTTTTTTSKPSMTPSKTTTRLPTRHPTIVETTTTTSPSIAPSIYPTSSSRPTLLIWGPTTKSITPTTNVPSQIPTHKPSPPTSKPSSHPTLQPTLQPTNQAKTQFPTHAHPSKTPTHVPTVHVPKTDHPTSPTTRPTSFPTHKKHVTSSPSQHPTFSMPSQHPTTASPTTRQPTAYPTRRSPTHHPNHAPTSFPTSTLAPSHHTKKPYTPLPTPANLPQPGSGVPGSPPSSPTPQKTSFVLMIADDLGWGDVSYQGGPLKTTAIDTMAASKHSIVFSNFHAPSVVCSPSRAGLLTGRVPDRDCVQGSNVQQPFKYQLRQAAPVVARSAVAAGLRTLFLGKFHLGDVTNPITSPLGFGFQSMVASPGNIPTFDPNCFCDVCTTATTPYGCVNRGSQCTFTNNVCWSPQVKKTCNQGAHTVYPFVGFSDFGNWGCQLYGGGLLSEPYTSTPAMPTALHLANQFSDFVNNLATDDAFYVNIGFFEPHVPFIAPPDITQCTDVLDSTTCAGLSPSDRLTAIDYYGAFLQVDKAVDQIRQVLQATGRYDNTVLLFTSDNGPEEFQYGGYGSAGPFRGRKRSIWEGGHRVPGILEWPSRIKENIVIPWHAFSGTDWPMTVTNVLQLEYPQVFGGGGDGSTTSSVASSSLSAADLPPISNVVYDGISWLPMLTMIWNGGLNALQSFVRPKPIGVCLAATSVGTSSSCSSIAWIDGQYKLIGDLLSNGNLKNTMLFDLSVNGDPEQHDLSSKLPTIAQNMAIAAKTWVLGVVAERNANCGGQGG